MSTNFSIEWRGRPQTIRKVFRQRRQSGNVGRQRQRMQ